MAKRDPSQPLKGKAEAYSFARACGYGIWESTRRAGANPETGQGSKWEARPDVLGRIAWWRAFGQSDEMLAEKRARLEQRLDMSAYGNIFQFATMMDRRIFVHVDDGTEEGTTEERVVKTPVIDWEKVANSPLALTISAFKFDKDTGMLVHFERDDALQAANQLRDMHGFKAPAKLQHAGENGGPIEVTWKSPTPQTEPAHG